jgi:hypothetical protein
MHGLLKKSLLLLGLLSGLAACGPVPHPFEHEAKNPLVEDRRALSALSVQPVGGLPGLDTAMIKALDEGEDVPAASKPPAADGLWLRGTWVNGQGVNWKLMDQKGGITGETTVPVPDGPFNDLARLKLAKASAVAVAHLLRGEDPKASDEAVDLRPHISLPKFKTPKDFDADGLRQDAVAALERNGFVASDEKPMALVLCEVRVTPSPPSLKNGQDYLEVLWIVQSPDGKELGRVAQANPVDHLLLTGYIGPLGHAIADAAAPGIVEVLRKKATP